MSHDEFAFIEWIRQQLPEHKDVLTGIGDDCAVVAFGARKLLLKVDSVAEGVHFQSKDPQAEYFLTPAQIGRKALARALSDIAAMGGRPSFALIAGTLPKDASMDFAKAVMRGIIELAKIYRVAIVGGETTVWQSSEAGLVLSLTLVGQADQPVLRSGAGAGDSLWLSGPIGGSGLGRHATFSPCLEEGQWLSAFGATAMMDVSDGLASDLPHLLKASGVGATLDLAVLPLRPDLPESGRAGALRAFGEGEDYVLLFALPAASDLAEFASAWPFATRPRQIATLEAAAGLRLRYGAETIDAAGLVRQGWRHRLGG